MDRKAEIEYFKQKIRGKYADDLKLMASIPRNAIDRILSDDPFNLSEEELGEIRRDLEFTFSVYQGEGSIISSEYEPWLDSRKQNVEFHYWSRLRNYYLGEDILPPNVVSQLDHVTDQILDYCGNPEDLQNWARRGMVMGHVQSGKTTNYISLLCKASDVGYKIIILLAGLTNSLRRQTQYRVDEGYIGKKSFFGATRRELMPIMHYVDQGSRQNPLHPAYGTTRDHDFQRAAMSNFGVSLDNLSDPIIFVTKKNKSILENLLKWIEAQSGNGLIKYPLLMIDDEADNASINTHEDTSRSTAINDVIRRLLAKFSRSSYVGYTATPFANIFIDPDTEDEMRGSDLFPRHFIKTLDPPTNYVGANRVFSPEGDLHDSFLREVRGYEKIIPLSHKKEHNLEELPPRLEEAIRVFILISAIRTLRGGGSKHCSMLINISRFNDVQEKVHGLVYKYQKRLDEAIVAHAGLGNAATRDPDIHNLSETFRAEFSRLEYSFADLLKILPVASKTIFIRTINTRNSEPLDYDNNRNEGLHVITIGGLALSRGLTLEGLCVSYILRNASASDTLMQMARWFGYHRRYEDLSRLYICPDSIDHYTNVSEAIEELRAELRRMVVREETPEQFGLKVRRSPTGIRITAANKMRTAMSMEFAPSFSCRHVEGYALENDRNVNSSNIETVLTFLKTQGNSLQPHDFDENHLQAQASKHFVWRDVDGQKLLDMVCTFRFHAHQPVLGLIDGKNSLFTDYCRDRLGDELNKWDVVVPLRGQRQASQFNRETLMSRKLALRKRNMGTVRQTSATLVYKPMGDRNSIRDPNVDARLMLSKAQLEEAKNLQNTDGLKGDSKFCSVRKYPLMIVHLFLSDLKEEKFNLNGIPIISLSFCMPKTEIAVAPKNYEVNAVFQRQIESLATESDDDENEIFDA